MTRAAEGWVAEPSLNQVATPTKATGHPVVPQHSQSLSAELLPSRSPQPVLVPGVVPPQGQDRALALVDLRPPISHLRSAGVPQSFALEEAQPQGFCTAGFKAHDGAGMQDTATASPDWVIPDPDGEDLQLLHHLRQPRDLPARCHILKLPFSQKRVKLENK